MLWIAKNEDTFPMLSGPDQLQVNAIVRENSTSSKHLDIGSIILEVSIDPVNPEPGVLLQYSNPDDPECHFSLWTDRNGATSAKLCTGGSNNCITTSRSTSAIHSHLRITYSWNLFNQTILLTIENLEQGTLEQTECSAPLPMPTQIINALLSQSKAGQVAPNVTFLGVSDRIEPVGFLPTIAEGSPVGTPLGPQMINDLKVGDLVTTVDRGAQPIRWICKRTVPAIGLFQPLRLRAPYFGLTRDVLVAPEQRIAFENSEVEYLFGVESVLVEVRHLTNNVSVLPVLGKSESVSLYQLLFDHHELITVAGCQMESLFVGQIADKPDVISSTLLKDMPHENLPRHEGLARPMLRSYEAMTLCPTIIH